MAQSGPQSPSRLVRTKAEGQEAADSGLEDELLTSSAGDLRSLGEPSTAEGEKDSIGECLSLAERCSLREEERLSHGEHDLLGEGGSLREGEGDSLDDLDDIELSGVGRGLLEVPVPSATFTAQLRQFLRAVRSPQQRRRAAGGGSYRCESPLDGSGGGSRSPPIEGRPDHSDLEFDWWAGQFSICGAEIGETDLFSWCLEMGRKVQVLERQVTLLADNQHNEDDRYTRSKQDNATLQARLIMMEEQLREAEMRSAEQLDSEQRRHKELMQRIEREKVLEVENQQIRAQGLEKELRHAEAEATRCQQQLQLALSERAALDERLSELQTALEAARLESAHAADLERRGRQEREQERAAQERLMSELAGELQAAQRSAHLRQKTESDEAGRVRLQQDHLEAELRRLREENKELQESNDELQAQLLTTGIQEGRQLLDSGAKSLAAELCDMSGDQIHPALITTVFHRFSMHFHHQLKQSLLEQQEVNKQLRNYIDGILLNIVENHPQLLEVKRSH